MKKHKLLIALLGCVASLVATLCFAACNNIGSGFTENNPVNTADTAAHQYAVTTNLSSNTTGHWNNCTVNGCTQQHNLTRHSFYNGGCVCGARNSNSASSVAPSPSLVGGHHGSSHGHGQSAPHMHDFINGTCACGATHTHDFTNGNCVCGATHTHDFTNGDCVCGATAPVTPPATESTEPTNPTEPANPTYPL